MASYAEKVAKIRKEVMKPVRDEEAVQSAYNALSMEESARFQNEDPATFNAVTTQEGVVQSVAPAATAPPFGARRGKKSRAKKTKKSARRYKKSKATRRR